MKMLRFALATVVAVLLVFVAGISLLYLLFQGNAPDGSAVSRQIEQGLQSIIGENHQVILGETSLDFSRFGSVVLKSHDIKILDRDSGNSVSTLGTLEVFGGLSGLWSGEIQFNGMRIVNAKLDWNQFGKEAALPLPADLKQPLNQTGMALARLRKVFSAGGFREIDIRDAVITGPVMGRNAGLPLVIERLVLSPEGETTVNMSGRMETEFSNIEIDARYSQTHPTKTEGQLELFAAGINLLEWLPDPNSKTGLLASNATISVGTNVAFDPNGDAADPIVTLVTTPGELRVGRKAITEIKEAEIHLRLILAKNQIELDPSRMFIGGLRATFVGGLIPENPERGYHGPIRYDLIMRRGEVASTSSTEQPIPAAFKIAGVFDHPSRLLRMEKLVMTTQNGSISGSGTMTFSGTAPAIEALAETDGISVAAMKQFWPFFIAGGARRWVHSHVYDGWVKSGRFYADIPAGVILKVGRGAVLNPDEYQIDLAVRDFKFRPFGDMPSISKGEGDLKIRGLSLEGNLDEGIVESPDFETVEVKRGRFFMEDFSAKQRRGSVNLELDGDVQSMAKISQRKPLMLMERMKVEADQFSGTGHADIVARFPVGKRIKYDEVDWNVLFEMRQGASSKKLVGRMLSNANLLVDANPTGARVTGTMSIDGVKSRVNLVEPIGKSGKTKVKRVVNAIMDEKARQKIGVNLDPVVRGPVSVKTVDNGRFEQYFLDFKDAELAMPWVGWSKGKGIPATAEFVLNRSKNLVRLEKFSLEGEGFSASGELAMDKIGLVSADLVRMKLNDFDDIRLQVQRKDKTFNINASGLTYDARGLVNALIHQGGFTKAQGERSVNLVANFETVIGFGNRAVRNVVLLYDSQFGRLQRLDLRGEGTGGQRYSIQAQLNGDQTLFTIKTNDAGGSLAFTNIYTRMQSGDMQASLVQSEGGPYLGPVRVTDFILVNEPRLKSMASSVRRQLHTDREQRIEVLPPDEDHRIRFLLADAQIERGNGYFNVRDAIVRSQTMGLTMDGIVYNESDRMNLRGTFIPAIGVNLVVSAIPLIGPLLSDGRNNALIGINYQLTGPRTNPDLLVNPLSAITPGAFNRVFESR